MATFAAEFTLKAVLCFTTSDLACAILTLGRHVKETGGLSSTPAEIQGAKFTFS